jgi:transcriptional antiterminator RfaH
MVRRNIQTWRARPSPSKALFPGYLFARFCPEVHLRAVTYARGVVRVVSGGERPLPVELAIIENLRGRMDATGCVTLSVRSFRPGEELYITVGPLEGWHGVFDKALGDAQRLVIVLQALNQGRLVVRSDWVDRCAAA